MAGGNPSATVNQKTVTQATAEVVTNQIQNCPGGQTSQVVAITLDNASDAILENIKILQNDKHKIDCIFESKSQEAITAKLSQSLMAQAAASGVGVSAGMGMVGRAGTSGSSKITNNEMARVLNKNITNQVQNCVPRQQGLQSVTISGDNVSNLIINDIDIEQNAASVLKCMYTGDAVSNITSEINQHARARALAGKSAKSSSKSMIGGIITAVVVVAVILILGGIGFVVYKKETAKKSSGDQKVKK